MCSLQDNLSITVISYQLWVASCFFADVVELADTHDSGSCASQHVGSTPTIGT